MIFIKSLQTQNEFETLNFVVFFILKKTKKVIMKFLIKIVDALKF
jgi:hypothetical protein